VLKSGSLGPQLVTYHNLAYMLGLMRDMRKVSFAFMHNVDAGEGLG
jgi:alkylated DNA nucleotide flippase Atl1